jgi:hypothetical protein
MTKISQDSASESVWTGNCFSRARNHDRDDDVDVRGGPEHGRNELLHDDHV